jgi:hypothetical protein
MNIQNMTHCPRCSADLTAFLHYGMRDCLACNLRIDYTAEFIVLELNKDICVYWDMQLEKCFVSPDDNWMRSIYPWLPFDITIEQLAIVKTFQ